MEVSIWRYDPVARAFDLGFPKPLDPAHWANWPKSWTGVDAAFNAGNGKAYFFRGGEYLRYDMDSGVDEGYPRPIEGQWRGLPKQWTTTGIDAAFGWGKGQVYFIKGDQVVRWDIAAGKADDPQPIAAIWPKLPSAWSTGLDAAVLWDDGIAHFFKGSEYIRYDVAGQKVYAGYPRPIAPNWRGLVVVVDWKAGPSVPRGAINVGRERGGNPLFLCAVEVGDAVYPGRMLAKSGSCNYSDGEREGSAQVFAVATTGVRVTWAAASRDQEKNLVPVGTSPRGRTYSLCRAPVAGGIHPGHFEKSSDGCTIASDGRSQTIKENFEIATMPLAANRPNIPLLVRYLSPLPNSERFKDVCGRETKYTVRDSAATIYSRDLPDMAGVIQTIARNSCAILYKQPSEVPKHARSIEVLIEHHPKATHLGQRYSMGETASGIYINPVYLYRVLSKQENVSEALLKLLYHEVTHATGNDDNHSDYRIAFLEGVADYVADPIMSRNHASRPGGDWKEGYESAAYFFHWIERKHPDFVYKLNRAARSGKDKRWFLEAIRSLTGKSVDELWKEYQVSLIPAQAKLD